MTEIDASADAPPPTPEGGAEDEHDADRGVRNVVEWVAIVAGALAVALLVKTFLIQAFFIPSLSMFPTLDEGDRVLVNKLSYKLHDINRGDMIVFDRPEGAPESDIKDLIKRVIGLPGETIETRDGIVYIDGERLEEPYLEPGVLTDRPTIDRQTIPAGHVWVMGDNRGNSEDSRYFGPIDEDTIDGRAFIRVWPLPDISLL